MDSQDAKIKRVIAYVKQFLLYGYEAMLDEVAYTADVASVKAKVVVLPNGHLGKDIVMPDIQPLRYHYEAERLIIETDIIYNTFFFLSLAEELLQENRDQHGRLTAKYSLLNNIDRLATPILDQYSCFILSYLELPLPSQQFKQIYLTHDVDTIAFYRHLRGALGGICRGKASNVFRALMNINTDPAFTFNWLIEQDGKVSNANVIYFFKDTPGKGYDYPQYDLTGKDCISLNTLLTATGAKIGWHSSYYSPIAKSTKASVIDYRLHRSHFLQIDIPRLRALCAFGVLDDFSIGFADMAGFRCQTTRPFRWIDPLTYDLSNLTIHPLTIMDGTLSQPNYMNLSQEEALRLVERLIKQVKKYNGELCLLWHNTSICADSYHQTLYPQVLTLVNENQG